MYATALSLLVLVLLPACVTDVETGRPEVQQSTPGAAAGIEDDAVETLVKSKVGDLDSCFQEEKRQNPKAQGRVLLAFTILPDGRAREAKILASTLASPVMEGCIVGKMEQWLFPRPRDGRPVQVRYPFAFGP